MAVSRVAISQIILAGLRKSPEQRDRESRAAQAGLAAKSAAEMVRYNAMSDSERREYDALTEGMMTHLRGAQRGDGRSPTGGRDD